MEVALALGGGGVKCFAQLGVLRALESAGVTVRALAATSAGGLVGGGLAAGMDVARLTAELADAQRSSRARRALRGEALLEASSAHALIDRLVADRTFADLDVPLALTVVDLDTGAGRILRAGPVAPALRAAIAIPGLYAPQTLHLPAGRWVDGGAVDPVPVRAARLLAPGLPVIAVVLTPSLADGGQQPVSARLAGLPVVRRLRRLRFVRAFEVFVRAADISHRALLESRLEIDRPELLIRPRVQHLDLFGSIDVAAVVAEGERAMIAALDAAPCGAARQPSSRSAVAAARRSRAMASATGTPAP